MSTPKSKRRRRMITLWNRGDYSFADIAERTGFTMDTVAEYLAKQPGFPDIIPTDKGTRICKAPDCSCEFTVVNRAQRYCDARCRNRRIKRAQRGVAPDAPLRRPKRYVGLTKADRQVLDVAKEEARERGTTRDAVLAEWKFTPERSNAA